MASRQQEREAYSSTARRSLGAADDVSTLLSLPKGNRRQHHSTGTGRRDSTRTRDGLRGAGGSYKRLITTAKRRSGGSTRKGIAPTTAGRDHPRSACPQVSTLGLGGAEMSSGARGNWKPTASRTPMVRAFHALRGQQTRSLGDRSARAAGTYSLSIA